jgi:hypothetical protein
MGMDSGKFENGIMGMGLGITNLTNNKFVFAMVLQFVHNVEARASGRTEL